LELCCWNWGKGWGVATGKHGQEFCFCYKTLSQHLGFEEERVYKKEEIDARCMYWNPRCIIFRSKTQDRRLVETMKYEHRIEFFFFQEVAVNVPITVAAQ
jgi:hypothetical protein